MAHKYEDEELKHELEEEEEELAEQGCGQCNGWYVEVFPSRR